MALQHAHLGLLLAAASGVFLAIVGSVFLLNRIPQLEHEIRTRAEGDAREMALRIELQLGSLQERLALLGSALSTGASARA